MKLLERTYDRYTLPDMEEDWVSGLEAMTLSDLELYPDGTFKGQIRLTLEYIPPGPETP